VGHITLRRDSREALEEALPLLLRLAKIRYSGE